MCVVVVVESGCGWCERGREVKRRCLVSRCGRGLRREEAARLLDEAGAKEAEVFAVSERARGWGEKLEAGRQTKPRTNVPWSSPDDLPVCNLTVGSWQCE